MKLLATILVLLQNPPPPGHGHGHGHGCHCGNCPNVPLPEWLGIALMLTALSIASYYIYKKHNNENN